MKYRIIFLSVILLYFLVFAVQGTISLDPDFGWHIRIGQINLSSGIPKTDPLSYSMPSYPYIQHEWLSNNLFAALYSYAGKMNLGILFAVLAIAAVVLQLTSSSYYGLLFGLFIFNALLPFNGIRTQIFTWLFFSIVVHVLFSGHKKLRLIFIPLLILWCNLHSGFPIFFTIYGIYILTTSIKQKRIAWFDIGIFIAALGATLINPYGYKLWLEIHQEVSDLSLHWSILEWMPAIFFMNIPLWMYVVISVTLTFRYQKKYSLFEKAAYIFLLLSGISTYRHMPLWILFSLIPTIKAMQSFEHEVKQYEFGAKRFHNFYLILLVISIIIAGIHIYGYLWGAGVVAEDKKYPQKAVQYLKKHPRKGEIFSVYEWGGYLTWKLSEKKVFMDGKMPNWKWKSPNSHESDYAFKEYKHVLYDKDANIKTFEKKYNITTLLMRKPRQYKPDNFSRWLETFIARFVEIPKQPSPKSPLLKNVKELYSDDVSIIYTINK